LFDAFYDRIEINKYSGCTVCLTFSSLGCVTACVVYGRFDSRFDSNEKNDSHVRLGFHWSADRMALFTVRTNPRWRPPPCWKNFKWRYISATGRPIHFMFCSMVGYSGTADLMALFSIRTNLAAAAILDNFEYPYLRNGSRSTYNVHRAVIFAIAQLSCRLKNTKIKVTKVCCLFLGYAYALS